MGSTGNDRTWLSSCRQRGLSSRSLNPYLLHLPLVTNLHSPERQLIELRIEHADLDAMIDRAADDSPVDELMMRRLKKRRLSLRDEMARVERELQPNEPA